MTLSMEESPLSHLFLVSMVTQNSLRREDTFSIIVDRLLPDEVVEEVAVGEAGGGVVGEGTGLDMG